MGKKILHFAVLLSFAILLFSFADNKSGASQTCTNYVSVYAQGLTVVHVTITAGSQVLDYDTDITSGTFGYYNSPYFTDGTTITVAVSILGQGAAPRMNSLGVYDQCNTYTNATQGSITAV